MKCNKCRLSKTRNNIVWGTGDGNADIMFIGEAPGKNEDIRGEPFIGRAGEVLDYLLDKVNLHREDIYITNIVKCLDGSSLVKTEDGWKRINWIHRNNYRGKVYCVDDDGRIEKSKITNSIKSKLLSRKTYKVSLINNRKNSKGKVGATITEDHLILTKDGWKMVVELEKNDKIHSGTMMPSDDVFEAMIGVLFGDGNITNNNFYIAHSTKQHEYLQYLANLFGKDLSVKEYNIGKYNACRFNIRASPYIRYLNKNSYINGKKRMTDKLLNYYSIISLAFHFMDDGYMRIREGRKPSAEIATLGYSDSEIKKLSKKIESFGINNYIKNKRIFFNVENTNILSKMIAPYIPKCMNYKLIPKHRQIEKIKLNIEEQPFYDDYTIEERELKYKYVYDITVEKNHNFITHSGVVHNCRPPNNRDPTKEEIYRCSDFLEDEIRTVNPKMIVPLGRFASEYISFRYGAPFTAMGEMHGIPYNIHDVTIIPMYHPAVVLYNPHMLKILVNDFRSLLEEQKVERGV
mgnify:CR=1 FL=1